MTPLERAARALADRADGGPWEHLPRAHHQLYIEDARAVLEAIREPSEAMKRAGTAVMRGDGDDKYWADAVGAYAAMIDAALAEEANA